MAKKQRTKRTASTVAADDHPITLDQIRKAHGPKHLPLPVPEWRTGNGAVPKVLAKRLSAPEFLEINELPKQTEAEKFTYMLNVVKRSLVNPDGSQLIGDGDEYLLTDHPALVGRLGLELLKFNRMLAQPRSKTDSTTTR